MIAFGMKKLLTIGIAIFGILAISPLVYFLSSNLTNFEGEKQAKDAKTVAYIIESDGMATNGVIQKVFVTIGGNAVLQEISNDGTQTCEYQMEKEEVIAIQKALTDVDEFFILESEAPELEEGMYRVFYKGKAIIVWDNHSENSGQHLVNSLYQPLREHCIGFQEEGVISFNSTFMAIGLVVITSFIVMIGIRAGSFQTAAGDIDYEYVSPVRQRTRDDAEDDTPVTTDENETTQKLPPYCPYCGGSIFCEDIKWIDKYYAECPYCGSAVSVEDSSNNHKHKGN